MTARDWLVGLIAIVAALVVTAGVIKKKEKLMQCVKLEIWRPGNWDCKTPDVSVDEPDFIWDEDEVTITTKNPDDTVTHDSYNIIGARVRTLNKPG